MLWLLKLDNVNETTLLLAETVKNLYILLMETFSCPSWLQSLKKVLLSTKWHRMEDTEQGIHQLELQAQIFLHQKMSHQNL